MAVAGVKNVEILRVANLSPERFHRLEEKGQKYQIWRKSCSSVSCPGSSSQKQGLLSSQMQLRTGRVDSGLLRYCLGTETSNDVFKTGKKQMTQFRVWLKELVKMR